MNFQEFIIKLQEELVYGSIAGLGICMVGHPFDTLKTRKQVMGGSYVKMIKDIIVKESPFAFYKGLTSPLVNMPIINSIVFSSYSLALSQLNTMPKTSDYSQDSKIILSSMFAGFINSFISVPMELFKIKLQIQKDGVKLYNGNIDLARKLYRVSGIKGLYQGFYLASFNNTISYAAQFYTYYTCIKYFLKQNGKEDEK